MSYASLAELHGLSNLVSVSDDVWLQILLDAADRQINRFCNRPGGFLATVDTRYYSGKGLSYQIIDECIAVATISVKDSATDSAYTVWTTPTTPYAGDGDWLLFSGDPRTPTFGRPPYTGIMADPGGSYSVFTNGEFSGSSSGRGVPTIRILGTFGYAATVPVDIKTAAVMQSVRWYKRLQGAMTTSLASSDLGQIELFAKLDPDVAVFLSNGRYVRPSILR